MPSYVFTPSYTDQGGEQSEGYESEEQLQSRILTAALKFVPTYGWTMDAIAEGAKVRIKRSGMLRDPEGWLFSLTQRSSAPGPRSTTGPWPVWNWAVQAADECPHAQFHLREWQPSTCAHNSTCASSR